MTAVDRSYLRDKMDLEGFLAALFLLICGLKCISKVYTIAESFDLLNERGDDDKSIWDWLRLHYNFDYSDVYVFLHTAYIAWS